MVMVELKGLHTVKIRRKGKPTLTYHYAWRGGPAVKGEPGTPEFQASYNEAVANHRAPDGKRFRAAVVAYKASNAFQGLAASTKRNWSSWLDRITDHFGELRIAQFGRVDKIRPIIRRWRAKYADTPRTADYGMQVLSRVLAFCVDPMGKIPANPCEGIKKGQTCGTCRHLYRNRMAKTYLKCSLMRSVWTGGAGTDILAKAPACRLYEGAVQ